MRMLYLVSLWRVCESVQECVRVSSCERGGGGGTTNHSSKIPKDEHVAPFFIKDVPSGGYHFFALHACIDVQEVSKAHKQKRIGGIA